MQNLKNWRLYLAVGGLSLAGGVVGAAAFKLWPSAETGNKVQLLMAPDGQNMAYVGMMNQDQDFVQSAEVSSPSVVFIKTTSNKQNNNAFNAWSPWDFWGYSGPISGAGSGVILSADGYIVTNNHVVDDADEVEVILSDKRAFQAKIVGVDPSTDLALLKVEAKDLKPIVLTNSDEVRTGQWVLAVGNPHNLTSTVTAGIVSAKGRNINIVKSQFPIESFIQTDAAINPGNSGGALVDLKGQLVGINTAIYSENGAFSGYGFAIPSNIVKKIVSDLIEYGEVQRAFIGFDVADIDSKMVTKLDDKAFEGVYVQSVEAGGAGATAGIQKGDVVVKLDAYTINSKAEFLERLSYHRPGDVVTLIVKRAGGVQQIKVKLQNREGSTDLIKTELYDAPEIGCAINPLSKVERQKLGVENGFRLVNIKSGIVRNLGLPEGFVVLMINKKTPADAAELVTLFKSAKGKLVIDGINPGGGKGTYSFFTY